MLLTKVDDYQTWRIDSGAHSLLIDPWLTDTLRFPLGAFVRGRRTTSAAAGAPTAVVVTAPFGDHCDEASLRAIDPAVPVFTNAQAARRMRGMGRAQVRVVRAGDRQVFDDTLSLSFVAPGFPYSHNSLGFCVEERRGEVTKRVYFETHVVGAAALRSLPRPIDALVSTMESVRLFGIQLSMDAARAAATVAALGAKHFVATGVDPGSATGLLPALLYVRSDRRAFERELAAAAPETKGVFLQPGEAIAI